MNKSVLDEGVNPVEATEEKDFVDKSLGVVVGVSKTADMLGFETISRHVGSVAGAAQSVREGEYGDASWSLLGSAAEYVPFVGNVKDGWDAYQQGNSFGDSVLAGAGLNEAINPIIDKKKSWWEATIESVGGFFSAIGSWVLRPMKWITEPIVNLSKKFIYEPVVQKIRNGSVEDIFDTKDEQQLKEVRDFLDVNHDNEIDYQELTKAVEILDKDKDGKVSAEELKEAGGYEKAGARLKEAIETENYTEEEAKKGLIKILGDSSRSYVEENWSKLDKDGNGVSKEEYQEALSGLDKDKDGLVTQEDLNAVVNQNNDGVITKEETKNASQAVFAQMIQNQGRG